MMKAMFSGFLQFQKLVGISASQDLADFLACFKLMGKKTSEGEAARGDHRNMGLDFADRNIGFRAADPHDSGVCSFAELEAFLLSALLIKYPNYPPRERQTRKVETSWGKTTVTLGKPIEKRGQTLWEIFRPSYIKAFTDAKDHKKVDGDVISGTKSATADDLISKEEFRLFCAYLCIYASMYDAFSKIDGGGEGRGGDDRKIDMAEWMAKGAGFSPLGASASPLLRVTCCWVSINRNRKGYKGVKEHGFINLASIEDAASAKLEFEAMDENGDGVLMLDEWCDYLKKKEIEARTKLGETLNEVARPTKVYSSGLIVGPDASKELFDFMDLFHPMAEKSPEAEKLREEGFVTADPNGNGLCSLAELETFVLKSLVTKFPKTRKGSAIVEPGKDLFDVFHPCYILAFTDAKDYEADTGEKIEGTKTATEDDTLSKKEFRLFCAHLCVYAAMFDAFVKESLHSGDGSRNYRSVSLKLLEKRYKGIGGFGFVVLKDLNTKADATAAFKSFYIDDPYRNRINGDGIVDLDEWCLFIKNAEIKAGTSLAAILNEDEAGDKSRDFSPGGKSTTSDNSKTSASSIKKWAADDGSKI